MHPNSVSLIITTYNWPKALELVLLSVLKQQILPKEVIIADDGSGEETRLLIESYQRSFPIPLIHSWQEDKGFRAARSRNLAIAKVTSEYVVFIDGDIVLHPKFIADHKRIAQKGYFVQGRRSLLSSELTTQVLNEKKIKFSLLSSQLKNKLNAISCTFLSQLLSPRLSKKTSKSIRSCNLAVWLKDIIDINGFNEDFEGWGREDSEFVVRLMNKGVLRLDLRFGGVGYHLYHNENSRKQLSKNDEILDSTITNRLTYCKNGLHLHLPRNEHL